MHKIYDLVIKAGMSAKKKLIDFKEVSLCIVRSHLVLVVLASPYIILILTVEGVQLICALVALSLLLHIVLKILCKD